MSNIALSRLERVYFALQNGGGGTDTDFQTVPTFGNSNYCRHIKATMKNNVAALIRRDKTGHRSATIGVRGRSYGTWTYEGSLAPSGVNGTAPDFDPIMQSIFSGPATSANGGLQYAFASNTEAVNLPFAMASYRSPSTLMQRIAYGCLANKTVFKVGEDIAEFTSEGECRFVIDSDYFSSASTSDGSGGALGETGGLVSFPSEPGSPVSHGGIIAGFTGSVSIGGVSQARLRTATITIDLAAATIKDTFTHYIPDSTESGVRTVTIAFNLYEDDSAGQQALRVASITKNPVDVDISVGLVAGSIVQFQLKNVQLPAYDEDDSALRYSTNWPDARAYGTSITSLDEIKITIK